MTIETLTPRDFVALAAERLLPEPPVGAAALVSPGGDHVIDGSPPVLEHPPKPAAVLVPVVMHPDATTILLTERTASLRDHSGQIAFPGGKIDPEDPTPLATALREAEEEIGLHRSRIEPIGYLDPYLSGTNYLVTPVVGLVTPPFTLDLNPHEVADAFEVPFAFLMDEVNHQLHSKEWKGRLRRFYAMPFGDRYIWGVTAGILRNLYERLYLR